MRISDEAVEAAAAGMWHQRPMMRDGDGAPIPFGEAKSYQRERFLSQARAALEAAAPHLKADAWDEGRKHGAAYPYGKRGLATDDNPYRD